MSLLGKIAHALLMPAAIPAAQQTAIDLSKTLADFRQQRANDFADLADRAGRSGAKLAATEIELARWREYACELERRCMGAGLELPKSPDEP